MSTTARLFLLPGTGGDHRLFPAPWTGLPDVVTPDWPRWSGETSLAEIAARLVAEYAIGPDDVVAGISLGAMVACEIARQTPVAGVVVIAGALHPGEVAPLPRSLAPAIRWVPLRLLQALVGKLPRLEFRMFAATDARFIREGTLAIFRWEGFENPHGVPVYRIHGRRDRVITPPVAADLRLDAGHMITVSHAAECAAATGRFADRVRAARRR